MEKSKSIYESLPGECDSVETMITWFSLDSTPWDKLSGPIQTYIIQRTIRLFPTGGCKCKYCGSQSFAHYDTRDGSFASRCKIIRNQSPLNKNWVRKILGSPIKNPTTTTTSTPRREENDKEEKELDNLKRENQEMKTLIDSLSLQMESLLKTSTNTGGSTASSVKIDSNGAPFKKKRKDPPVDDNFFYNFSPSGIYQQGSSSSQK